MILSHEHKFIFIHIGKTGGTSIEKVLCEELNIPFEETKKNPKTGNWWKHAWSMEMRNYVGYENWDEYFKFAFVRNPYDMLLSLYSMYTQYPEYIDPVKHENLYHPWNQFKSYEDLVMGMISKDHEPNKKWSLQLKKLGAKNTMQVWESLANLQSKYLTDHKGNLLVDFVGKFETLQQDFNYCCKKIGIKPIDLICHGATKHKDFRDVYTKDMFNFVTKHSWKDIWRFGYEHSISV